MSAVAPSTGSVPTANAVEPDLFTDGGETGALMRAIDWSASPLGPVAQWPKSLRTCVRIILTSRQPMFLWWGPRLINLYNDAYRAIVGGKHPWALKQPASEVWKEIWDEVGPRAETCLRTNRGTYDEALLLIMQRHGYQEETYYTFSYSPVPSDDGSTGGIICANTDETDRIIDERRMAVLRDLAARTAHATTWEDACHEGAQALGLERKDIPFSLIYLLDEDQKTARLTGVSGMARENVAAVPALRLDGPSYWRVAEALASRELQLVDIPEGLDLPSGAWPLAPTRAAVIPLLPGGDTGRAGVLVVGLNPYRTFDARYRDFVTLVGSQVAAGIAHAGAYQEERRRAEALAELDRAKTLFFSNVSHEFRTPLTLMLGPMEDSLADRVEPLPPRQRERQELIHRNGLRLLRLVNDLLDFSRIEAGRVQASYQPLDLAAVTTDLASTFRSAIERAGIHLEVACPPLPQSVHADPDMWEKIVLNLLSNAFKHTFAGTIRIALVPRGHAVELTVADTGIGIPADQLPRLFERFHRVQGARSRTHEGTGIGLALVQELVRLHGGTVEVHSVEGQGSTFTITIPMGSAHLPREQVADLPRRVTTSQARRAFAEEALRWLPDDPATPDADAEPDPDPGPTLTSLGGAVPAGGHGGRVLVADDNADMRFYVQRLLSDRWQVQVVADGAAALASALSDPPDLILSDVMMPELDGIRLVRALRADERTRYVPVILLFARAGEEAGIEGLEAGADDYLTKPFSAQELLARVTAHLQLKRQRAEAADAVARNERLLRLVTQHARIGLAMVDEQHRYLFVNATHAEVLGSTQELMIGRNVAELVGSFYEATIAANLERAFSGQRASFEMTLPADATHLDERSYLVTYEPFVDAAAGRCV
ncbi:MAG TPA: ATP-binding protein, partial [Planctomycetota bacterium]|nr:ATP-binding protein [Planctomycetota bacterium]